MSRNNKSARNKVKEKAISAMHLKGEKGAASTTPLHGKRFGYRTNPDTLKRIAEALKASQAQDKNATKKFLENVGAAAVTSS